MPLTILLIVLLIALVAMMVSMYNRLVGLRNRCQEAFAQIDVELKRRADLIDNLVQTVKGYASHEKETFTKVTEARSMVAQAGSPGEQAKAEGFLQSALKSLFAVVENYPELKANENFMALQRTLEDVENRIAGKRSGYNDTVRQLNALIQSFPANMVAGMYGFKEMEYYELSETKREELEEAPEVSFKEKKSSDE